MSRRKERFAGNGVRILAIAPEIDGKQFRQFQSYGGLNLTLAKDADHKAFASYGCMHQDELLHGLFLVSPQGKVQWQQVSDAANTEIENIFSKGNGSGETVTTD